MATIIPIETPSLGDRSYLAHDGEVAFVVDPQRDIDRVLSLAQAEGVRITHVLETHVHNDYVTGGLALAEATGAAYLVNGADEVGFERTAVHDGDVVAVGVLQVRAIATPGHTFTHLSYVVSEDGGDVAVFTGGSLLFGSTGRPDLLGPEHTDELVRHQHASVRRLADEVGDRASVLPTHGFGSFCSATQSDATESTIGSEKQSNPALTTEQEGWVNEVLGGLDVWPAYYAHIAPVNVAGPSRADLSPPASAGREDIRSALTSGEWVVDLRTRSAYAAEHVRGTFNFGLDGSLATYLGWLIPWGTPLTLLGSTEDEVAEAQRELSRIGIERPAGAATGGPSSWGVELGTYPTSTFAELAAVRHHRPVNVLDVRRAPEFEESHIEGAVNVPIHEVLGRLDDVPSGEVWVHCAAGYRASVVGSILAAHGIPVVVVDDSFAEHAAAAGLPLTTS